jgi:uncharacterized protein
LILVDANLLLYAYNSSTPEYARAKAWLESILNGPETVALSWNSIWAFLRVCTNKRYSQPMSAEEAFGAVRAWMDSPNVVLLTPGALHFDLLQDLVKHGQATGPILSDAVLAALAIEHAATLASTDQDFSRFSRLSWINPLAR